MVERVVGALPEAALLGLLAYVFGAFLKVSDLLQEHGYRWFRGSAVTMGVLGSAFLLVVLGRADDAQRVFWLAVVLHWVLRGRIDGVNHGIFATSSLVALAFWSPSLLADHVKPFVYFFVPFTVLGLLHDGYQYGARLPGPEWLKKFFENQHLYWYLVIAGHPLVLPFNVPLLVAGVAFVKGYGLFYSERALALLPRLGIERRTPVPGK